MGEINKLISFVLLDESCLIEEVKKHIEGKLPYYMVPSEIMVLKDYPYNLSHKVDRNKLIELYKNS